MDGLEIKSAGSCMWDAASLGEIMLRLDPGDGRIHTTREFKAWEGGGEKIVVRPDHGRFMEIDKSRKCYAGYSYGGRLIGLAELRGLEIGLKYAKKGL